MLSTVLAYSSFYKTGARLLEATDQKHKKVIAEYSYTVAQSDLLRLCRPWLCLAFNALNIVLENTAQFGTKKNKLGVYKVPILENTFKMDE